jgi:hypothetical protein
MVLSGMGFGEMKGGWSASGLKGQVDWVSNVDWVDRSDGWATAPRPAWLVLTFPRIPFVP